jgi:hypothetical protein
VVVVRCLPVLGRLPSSGRINGIKRRPRTAEDRQRERARCLAKRQRRAELSQLGSLIEQMEALCAMLNAHG